MYKWRLVCRGGLEGGGWGGGGREGKREMKERRERERRKYREKRKKRKEKEKKERKMKEASGFFLSSLVFRWLELVRPRSKVRRFDEGLRFKRCRVDTGGRRSNETVIMKKADM